MESPSNFSDSSAYSPTVWDYLFFFLFRPLSAIFFSLFILLLGWWLAWKLVLVHVPLVQEIFGLRKKPAKRPPPKFRYSQLYNAIDANRNQPYSE